MGGIQQAPILFLPPHPTYYPPCHTNPSGQPYGQMQRSGSWTASQAANGQYQQPFCNVAGTATQGNGHYMRPSAYLYNLTSTGDNYDNPYGQGGAQPLAGGYRRLAYGTSQNSYQQAAANNDRRVTGEQQQTSHYGAEAASDYGH